MRASVPASRVLAAALCAALGCTSLRERTDAPPPSAVRKPPAEAQIIGRVSTRGMDGALGHAAVFLEPIDEAPAAQTPDALVIRQRLGQFDPDFAVSTVGQPVRFANQDKIFHGVFSYSPPNQFERRPYAPGESRSVTFRHPGAVLLYSPLHTDMRGVILVVPGPQHVVPNAHGVFQIKGVPAGRYRLSLWTRDHGGTSREISLAAGEVARADLALSPTK